MNLIAKVKSTIAKYQLIEPRDRLLIGLSGGPDSVALLHILLRLKEYYQVELFGCHLNHSLRGIASDRDAKFVEKLAAELNLPCKIVKTKIVKPKRGSLEAESRKIRYEFLEEARKEFNATKIVLGHNLDDQIETMFYRMIRGSSLDGIYGIPVKRGFIIRPLIEVYRTEIIDFLKKNKIVYRIDRSNYDLKFSRNWVRHKLIPTIEKRYKQFKKNIFKLIEILKAEVSFLSKLTDEIYNKIIITENKDYIEFCTPEFLAIDLNLKRRLLNKAFYKLDIKPNFNYINSIVEYVCENKQGIRQDSRACIFVDKNKIKIYKNGKTNSRSNL